MEEIGDRDTGIQTLTLDLFSNNPPPTPCPRSRSKKRPRSAEETSPFECLSEEILFLILDRLDESPLDRKAFSLVSRSLHAAESRHRRVLRPRRSDLLPAALSRYPSVSHLDLSLCPRVGDAALAAVAGALRSSLRSVDLSRSRSFSQIGLACLAVTCAGLVEIDLSNGTDLSDAAAAAIAKARNLEKLWLARCKMVTDTGLGCVAVGCPKLRLLCLKWCLGVTDLGVGLVAAKCKKLQSLDLSYTMVLDVSNCQHVTHLGLSSILSRAPGLCQLKLAYFSPFTQSLSSSLQKLSKLQSIRLDGCPVTSARLKTIANSCTSLKELSLIKCSGVTDEGLSSVVVKHKTLMKLDITCCRNITDVSVANITSSCSALTSLRMESCVLVSNEGFRLIGRHCQLLEELDLTDNDVDDEGLKAFSSCCKLSSLKIGLCLNISDEGLVHVGKSCPELQELDLYRSIGVTDKGVSAIASGCCNLQIIDLAYCMEITDESLRSLSTCHKLNTLEIRGCPGVTSTGLSVIARGCRQITKLDLKKCYDVNDAGMFPLACYSQSLRQINLSYCSVTDVGLLVLASMSCLQSITMLHLTGVTANGLVAALLSCRSLTKVKLHSSFKSLISQPLFKHIEARGCLLQWVDKPFQVGMEPNEVWKQQSQAFLSTR